MVLTEILVIAIIAILLGYIVYLHLQLVRKNLFIESMLRKPGGPEKIPGTAEMMRFLQEIKKIDINSLVTDRLFGEEPLSFLLENEDRSRIFIHYTKDEGDARNIIREGFLFTDSFYKTALPVTNDRLDLMIKHNGRKSFGDYMIVLSLSRKVFDHFGEEIERRGLKGVSPENILTEKPPFRNDNSDLVFRLPNSYVKGYINHQTGAITRNPDFDPAYQSPQFENNLSILGAG